MACTILKEGDRRQAAPQPPFPPAYSRLQKGLTAGLLSGVASLHTLSVGFCLKKSASRMRVVQSIETCPGLGQYGHMYYPQLPPPTHGLRHTRYRRDATRRDFTRFRAPFIPFRRALGLRLAHPTGCATHATDLTRFLAPCRRAPGLRLAQRAQGQARGRRPPGREARGGGAAASEPHVPQPARRLAD